MNVENLKATMAKANKEGKEITAYAVVSQNNLAKEFGVVSYVLTSTFDRNTDISVFPTLEAAQDAMRSEMANALGVTVEALQEYLQGNLQEYLAEMGKAGEFSSLFAWTTDRGGFDYDADWNIFPVFNDGENMKKECSDGSNETIIYGSDFKAIQEQLEELLSNRS